jgi:hypothetical protein
MLDMYNPNTATFFTPSGELGFALHEMFEVSGLSMGEVPYEEYVPGAEELQIIRRDGAELYETYWELLCHFHICLHLTGARSGGVKQACWANYLFPGVEDKRSPIGRLKVATNDEIEERISQTVGFYTTESAEDAFKADTTFESFHHQARTPISDRALLAGFLMLWLKKCVVPTLPHEAISMDVVYPAVMLACGRPIGLLPAMVSCLQSGLRVLTTAFCRTEEADLVDCDGMPLKKTPVPRVELPYTYLMAWFMLHCPALMTSPHSVPT